MNETIIITGASRGLGAALAEQLLSPSRRLIVIARGANPVLAERARALSAPLEYLQHDLSQVEATAALAERLAADLRAAPPASRYVLINNAGTVEPVALAHGLPAAAAAMAMNLNVVAVMTLTAAFLAATQAGGGERRILNISSNAGRRPVPGWGVYCSTKAALDMYSRCIKAEQEGTANPARVCSLAPGVIDTEMQSVIRGSRSDQFPQLERFLKMKAEGTLSDPASVAQRLIGYLNRDDFGEREIDDIRNY